MLLTEVVVFIDVTHLSRIFVARGYKISTSWYSNYMANVMSTLTRKSHNLALS